MHIVNSTNHLLHWVLIVLTLGFWLIIYGFIILFASEERVCTICGKRVEQNWIGAVVLLGLVVLWFAPDIVTNVSQKLSPLVNGVAEAGRHLIRNIGVFEFFLTFTSFTLLLVSYAMLWYYEAFEQKQIIITTVYWLLFSMGLILWWSHALLRLYLHLQS